MKENQLQFAVVREDPLIELEVIEKYGIDRAVMIGSGGCTFLTVKSRFPSLEITLIEPNPAQIQLVNEKIRILKSASKDEIYSKFGVGKTSADTLIEGGNFESLFRQFRSFLNEFVAAETEIEQNFGQIDFWEKVFAHRYWPTSFDLFFSDAILRTMFGEAAIQHAPKNSYPTYFRRVLERGLLRADAAQNYFLHHIFLGWYRNEATLPEYLIRIPENFDVEFFRGFAQDFDGYRGRALVHFSNIFDWCDETIVAEIGAATAKLEKGSVVVFRQLNNNKNYRELFGSAFRWSDTTDLTVRDRSLFYEKIEIGEKIL